VLKITGTDFRMCCNKNNMFSLYCREWWIYIIMQNFEKQISTFLIYYETLKIVYFYMQFDVPGALAIQSHSHETSHFHSIFHFIECAHKIWWYYLTDLKIHHYRWHLIFYIRLLRTNLKQYYSISCMNFLDVHFKWLLCNVSFWSCFFCNIMLLLYRIYHLKCNLTTVICYSTLVKSEVGPPLCGRLFHPVCDTQVKFTMIATPVVQMLYRHKHNVVMSRMHIFPRHYFAWKSYCCSWSM
jgi:hypothetical protein